MAHNLIEQVREKGTCIDKFPLARKGNMTRDYDT